MPLGRSSNAYEFNKISLAHLILEKLWTRDQCASVMMPATRLFRWPTNKTIAKDARGKGPIDADGAWHLFWNLDRTGRLERKQTW